MKILDKYIIRKFLGTFFFTMSLIILIVLVIDLAEKVDDFIEKKAPMHAILVDYYLNFIPWINGLLWPLFALLAVAVECHVWPVKDLKENVERSKCRLFRSEAPALRETSE